jgi:hypothetical protein
MCFTDYIGILDTDASTTGLYVRQLGIPVSLPPAINTNYLSGISMLRDILAKEIDFVKNDFKRYAKPYWLVNSVIDGNRSGKFEETFSGTSGKMTIENNICDCSILSSLFVSRIIFKSHTTVNDVPVVVTDGADVYNYLIDVVADTEYSLDINKEFKTDNVTIEWSGVVPYDTERNCCGNYITIVENNTHGIIADIVIKCSDDKLCCMFNQELKYAIYYKYAETLMNHARITDRINFFTLTTNEYKELELFYNSRYKEEMQKVVDSIPALLCNIDKFCVQCNSTRYVEHF